MDKPFGPTRVDKRAEAVLLLAPLRCCLAIALDCIVRWTANEEKRCGQTEDNKVKHGIRHALRGLPSLAEARSSVHSFRFVTTELGLKLYLLAPVPPPLVSALQTDTYAGPLLRGHKFVPSIGARPEIHVNGDLH